MKIYLIMYGYSLARMQTQILSPYGNGAAMNRTPERSAVSPRTESSGRRNAVAEEVRLRYLYRRLVLNGGSRLTLESARGLVGPDCAYHLYGVKGWNKKRGKNG